MQYAAAKTTIVLLALLLFGTPVSGSVYYVAANGYDGIQLVRYDNLANLQSANYGPLHGIDPIYQGPGITYGSDFHLYIRLQNNPNDLIDPLGKSIVPVPAGSLFNEGNFQTLVRATMIARRVSPTVSTLTRTFPIPVIPGRRYNIVCLRQWHTQ